jgi:hypothetical protein
MKARRDPACRFTSRSAPSAITLVLLLTACGHLRPEPQAAFDRTAELAGAIRLHGPPMLAKLVSLEELQLVGKTIVVEGFLLHYCSDRPAPECLQSEDRFAIFSGDQLPPRPGPRRQPCPMTERGVGYEVVVGGVLPAGYGHPRNRRALILGTVTKREVKIPIVEARGSSGMSVDLVSDFALDNVTVLALYDSWCDWPH